MEDRPIVTPYKAEESKKKQVERMFDNIAPKYDLLNRVLSLGIDIWWRRRALGYLRTKQPKEILDVATGTADLAIMIPKMLQPLRIVGIDIANQMLDIGREKIIRQGLAQVVELETGDSERLRFADASFDAVTVAFGVRNFEHLEKGLQEMRRVLKPNGKLVILEFSRPKQQSFKGLYNFYMKVVAPKAGSLFAGNKDAYSYLNKSVQAFPEREQFTDLMQSAGYKNIYFKTLSLGICCIYCGSK